MPECAANSARSLLTTITFLGEPQDRFDPDAAVPVAGHPTERRSSVRQRPVDDPSGHAHQVTRRDLVLATVPCRERPFLATCQVVDHTGDSLRQFGAACRSG